MAETSSAGADDQFPVGGKTHSVVFLTNQPGWRMHVSHSVQAVERLVVFIHGFSGNVTGTWHDFPAGGSLQQDWWRRADLLFVGYRSTRDDLTAVAHRLRAAIPTFYPVPYSDALQIGEVAARDSIVPYNELVIVGHSLGGLIARRAMVDAAKEFLQFGRRSVILDAKLRLFSPASAGFRAAGPLGLLRATVAWNVIEMVARRSSAYTDLQPGSDVLLDTRKRTEELASRDEFAALRAFIRWASPDDVVMALPYETDYIDNIFEGKSHTSVCKPSLGSFEDPWTFVETGGVE